MPGFAAPTKKLPFGKSSLKQIRDLSGGLNNKFSPLLIEDTELQVMENFHLDQKGTLQQRLGFAKHYAATFATGPVRGLYNYRKDDGTSRLVIAADDKLFYDTPQFLKLYDLQAEWEAPTAVFTKVTSKAIVGEITLSVPITGLLGSMVLGGPSSVLGATAPLTRSGTWQSDSINIS